MEPVQVADELDEVVLVATPQLRKLDVAAITHRPAPDRWTIKQVIGHLIDSAANNHQRFVRAQFVPELIFPKYQQNEWVQCQAYDEVAWPDVLELWQCYNRHLAHIIRHVRPQSLNVRCTIGDYPPVTLQFLIEDYLVHLKHHLAKVRERVSASK